MSLIRVVMQAKDIPDGATVSKKTGMLQYTVRRELRVYYDKHKDAEPTVLKAQDGAVFLVGREGDINAYDRDTELLWFAPIEELAAMLEEILNGVLR
jgi:hypothetical protein